MDEQRSSFVATPSPAASALVASPGAAVDGIASGISLIIPALNEAESIGPVLRELPWELLAECIVVDNGSTDATAAIAQAAGARVIESPRGYGAACFAGAEAAAETSEVLVFMDGDGADVVSDLSRLIGPIVRGEADFVIGSRLRGRREAGSMLPQQIVAARLVGLLLRLMGGGEYSDMGPFRAIRRSSYATLQMAERSYGWNLEMQIVAARRGLRVLEIPVDYRRRIGGESKVSGNIKASAIAVVRIFAVLFRVTRAG